MTLTPGAFLRVGLLVLLAIVLQVSGLSQLTIAGGTFDLIPLAVAAVAFFAGSIPGSITGFVAGIVVDLALGGNLGATSLVLTAVGYGVGRFREVRDPAHGLIAVPVAAAATAGYLAALAGVAFLLEIESSVSALVLREALIGMLLNVAIALPFFGLARRVLRPVLVVDPLERPRRRRSTTRRSPGPLGLRGLGA